MGSRLYFKLLAWFIGTSLLAIIATLVVVQPLWHAIDETAERLPDWGQQAVDRYEQEGVDALREHLRSLRKDYGAHALLLDENLQPVMRVRMPLQVRERLLPSPGHRRSKSFSLARVSRLQIRGQQGNYHWHVLRPPPGPEQWRTLGSVRLVVFLLVLALAALLFTYWLGRPIKQLRAVTEDMAAGNLGSRANETLTHRKDEIGELSHAFNRMAERVQALLTNKERLLRDVSHELRSPLARLEVALELARDREGAKSTEALVRIDLETQRLKSLIDQIMTLSRLDDPDSAYSFEPLNLGELVTEVCDDLSVLPSARLAPSIETELDVLGNKSLLRSAVENIVRNAIKYSSENHSVDVVLARQADQVVLCIRDHGEGVADDQLENIFRPFYRTQTARTRHPEDDNGGYGVGLSIVQRVAQLHKGSVIAHNHPDGGLEVCLSLPLLRK